MGYSRPWAAQGLSPVVSVGMVMTDRRAGAGRPRRTPPPAAVRGAPDGAQSGAVDTAERSGPAYFLAPERSPVISPRPGLATRVLTGLHGEPMMMVLSATLPGHEVPIHSHPHEQIGMVFSGTARLRIGDEERVVSKGDFYRIPPGIPHGDGCLGSEPFVMLDIFCPIREDFLERIRSPSAQPQRTVR